MSMCAYMLCDPKDCSLSEPSVCDKPLSNMDSYGKETLRRNGVALTVSKRVQNAVLGCNLKNDRMISVRF